MTDRKKVIKGLEICTTRPCYCTDCPYKKDCVLDSQEVMKDALELLKEQEAMTPEEFKNGLLKMFSSIWECEIDHPMFQDTVGELMDGVMQLYKKAVKWK